MGRRKLSALSPADVRRFINSKADAGLAPATVKKLHVVLGSALQQAVRDDVLSRNVARNVQVAVPNDEPVRPLDHDEVRRLLKAASDDRLYALWAVAIGIGLRRGEALGLWWSDIDLDRGTLRVDRTLQQAGGELQLTPPKTARSRRTIPLPRLCRQALADHRCRQDDERRAAGDAWTDSGFVFTLPDGSPVQPRYVNRWLDDLCERAGVRRIRVHDLRHTCARLLLAQGVSPRVVMEVLGHSQIGVTMNTYAHVLPVLQQQAAEQMDVALDGDTAGDTAGNGAALWPNDGPGEA